MRLRSLNIEAFGHFTDRKIDFGDAGESDLYVFFGPNEAGKSTVRRAIDQAFYGIDVQTTMDFVHEKPRMRIGAEIEHDGKRLAFSRLKKNKKSLVGANGAELGDDALMDFLGSVSAEHFLRMYALDHDALVHGGREMLNPSSPLGQILFQSAAGLNRFSEVLASLDTQASAIFSPRARSDRGVAGALKRFDDARRALGDAKLTGPAWNKLRKAYEAAKAEYEAARQTERDTTSAVSRLERIVRVSHFLRSYEAATAQVAALQDVVRLPSGALATASDVRSRLETEADRRATAEGQIAQLETELARLPAPHPIAEASPEIEQLIEAQTVARGAKRDLPPARDRVNQLRDKVRECVRDLGWANVPVDTLDDLKRALEMLPTTPTIDQIAAQITVLIGYEQKLETMEEAVASASREVAIAKEALAKSPRPEPHPAMAAAHAAAQRWLAKKAVSRTQPDLLTAQTELSRILARLEWSDGIEALTAAAAPPEADLETAWEAIGEAEDEAKRLRERIETCAQAVDDLNDEIAGLRAGTGVVGSDEVARLRTERDGIWRGIQDSPTSLADTSPTLTAAIAAADSAEDRRFEHADTAATLGLKERELRRQIDARSADEAALEKASANVAAAKAAYAALCAPCRIPSSRLKAALDWLNQRQTASEVHARLVVLKNAAAAETADEAEMVKALVEALAGAAPAAEKQTLDLCIALVDAHVSKAADAADRAQQAEADSKAAGDLLARAEREKAPHASKTETARKSLAKLMDAAALTYGSDLARAQAAVKSARDMRGHVDALRDLLVERIQSMEGAIQIFHDQLRAMVVKYLPGQSFPDGEGLDVLRHTMDKELEAAAERRRLTDQIKAQRQISKIAEQAETAQHARVSELMKVCGAADLDALVSACGRSDEARAATDQLEQIRTHLLQAGNGADLETLVADDASVPLDQRDTLLADAQRYAREAREVTESKGAALKEAELAFKAAGTTDSAALADARRSGALADLSDLTDRYIETRTAQLMLSMALERYRERTQGPLLALASHYFNGLTQGQHVRLLVPDPEAPRLVSRSAAGRDVEMSGLSDGTRDQVFLALRLASLEQAIENGRAMPFIADDLLINFSDERAVAGFAALERLSKKTQVIYFTHHRHLLDLASKATDGRARIVEMIQS